MKHDLKELDVVALKHDRPDLELVEGQVGTLVATLAKGVYEVEFCDDQGVTYATASLSDDELLALHYRPVAA